MEEVKLQIRQHLERRRAPEAAREYVDTLRETAGVSLGRIVGPLWGGFAFDLDINYPFWSGAAILLTGFGVSLVRLSSEPIPESDATLKVAEGNSLGFIDDKVNPLVKTSDRQQ